ncbi:hypothetical protein [Streptomyces sp. NPDC058664]|uniref:hypothetical protein n=1 Tax=unclassified Streptomyces TaxID=2593676 RepID=UPI0036590EAE
MLPRKSRPAVLFLAAVLVGGGLTGCSSGSLLQSCEGSEARVEELGSLGILDSRPAGAAVPRDYPEVNSGCTEDSGDVWLHADRIYAFPGTRAQVLQHYRTAAERDGWKLVTEDPAVPAAPGVPAGLCFTRGTAEDGDMKALNVFFLTPEYVEFEDQPPGPEFDSGSGYGLSATAAVDGTGWDSC